MNRIQSELQRMIDNAKKMGPKSDEKKIADLLDGWLSEPSTPESRTAFAKAVLQVLAESRCDRCDGDGKAHGSDRPFEWSGPGTYPGPCPKCNGTGRPHSADLLAAIRLLGDARPKIEPTESFWTPTHDLCDEIDQLLGKFRGLTNP